MPQYIYAYHGGEMPETEEEAAREMAEWEKWFAEMGAAVVIPGNPVGASKTVTLESVTDGGGPNPISGFTVVEAETIDAAVEMAKGCPSVKDGTSSIEVAEIIEM